MGSVEAEHATLPRRFGIVYPHVEINLVGREQRVREVTCRSADSYELKGQRGTYGGK